MVEHVINNDINNNFNKLIRVIPGQRLLRPDYNIVTGRSLITRMGGSPHLKIIRGIAKANLKEFY
jgi:hypothetical protein